MIGRILTQKISPFPQILLIKIPTIVIKMASNSTYYYGYISGMLTAAALQPLDNIKMALIVPPSRLNLSANFVQNIYSVARYMGVEEGVRAFYRGLVVNVWKTGLGSALYFYALRMMESVVEGKTVATTFITSACARVVSSALTNPLAVAETRYQMGEGRWEGNILQNMYRLYRTEGISSFFKGCRASCLKQAGFAGVYYSLYQKGKELGLSSVVAGMGSGMLSTMSTHPLQIIRTNNQLGNRNRSETSMLTELNRMLKQGKLFDGVAPRLIKKPAANTIGFLLFEHFERMHAVKTN